MEYRRLGRSDIEVSLICLGSMTWGEQNSEAEAFAQMDYGVDQGINFIDTAEMYAAPPRRETCGRSEEIIGNWLAARGSRDKIVLATKITGPSDGLDYIRGGRTRLNRHHIAEAIEGSLRRLGIDRVDLALIHWPSKTVPLADLIAALNEVRARGLARNIGVSNFTVALIEQAVALSAYPLACNQVEYHPFLNQDRVLAACRKHGLAMVSYCPLARGSELFGQSAVAEAAARHGKTPAQVVLRWHVQQDGVAAIPRSSDPGRIRENLGVFDFILDAGEVAAIDALRPRTLRICDFDFSPQWDRN